MAGSYLGGRISAQVPGTLLLVAFAVMMLATATAMIRGRRAPRQGDTLRALPALGLGVLVGAVTGFVGAGGGFLIVPALVLVGGLPMVAAIGTSLLVISMQSAAGLAGHLSGTGIPWPLALAVTLSAVLGSVVGTRLCGRFQQDTLRRGFGGLVLVMAVLVLVEQLPRALLDPRLGWLAAAAATVAALTVLGLRRAGRRTDLVPAAASRDSSTGPTCPTDPAMEKTMEPTTATAMHFAQYYLDCLSQASYLIGDTGTGQAVVVDPRRDIAEYLADAEEHGLTDRRRDQHPLPRRLPVRPPGDGRRDRAPGSATARRGRPSSRVRSLADGERIVLGDVVLQIMATPGHTPESISVLVFEHAEDEVAVRRAHRRRAVHRRRRPARPAGLDRVHRRASSARQLYDSIQHQLMGLADEVRVFPAHGAGSACGKNLSTERQSTIGEQRRFNYACQPMTEEQFLALVTAGQPAAPEYFVYDAILNRKNRDTLRRRRDASPR